MIQQLLLRQLDRLAARDRYLRASLGLSFVWLLAAAAGGLLWIWKLRTAESVLIPAAVISGTALLVAIIVLWLVAHSSRGYAWLAQKVETAFPELDTRLMAAIQQRPDLPGGEFGYLQACVIQEAVNHSREHPWRDIVPRRQLLLVTLTNFLLFGLFAAVLCGVVFTAGAASAGTVKIPSVLPRELPPSLTVEPGNTEVERGTSLLVLARIQGPMPSEGALVITAPGGEETQLTMPPSLNDPVLSARIPLIDEPLEYHVRLEGITSPRYRVTVFEFPRLERADMRLVYPEYAGLESRLVQDVRTVSVVEGTQVTVQCKLNKPVATAVLANLATTSKPSASPPAPEVSVASSSGDKIVLAPSATDPLIYEATLTAATTRRVRLELTDDAGRQNKKPEQFTIHVLPNQPPTLKPVFPARDLEVSALEELDLKAAVSDDFGIQRFGVTYALAGQDPVEVVLATATPGRQKQELAHQVRLEDLKAEPDQLLSYYWWAEDFDATGTTRITQSDMYFAEVRPFEEIFRQGEQPPGGQQQQQQQQQGQGQNAQQAQELAKLQKDIINATWKLIRRETSSKPTAAFQADAQQVRTSQASAREQAERLGENLQDEESQGHLDNVLEQMATAVQELQAAEQEGKLERLRPALAAEQGAYQSLLKLRAREHEVVRQQQQQQGQQSQQQSSSRSAQQQQQMQQLDLQNEENRYETQRTAQEQQQESEAERENRQVLNRLRELARRQHDLNERLKELQAALEAAQSEPEKEELQRQLQRLQEEQRNILQDTDELQSRLDQPENQEQMAEQQQQLQETREQVRRASEALEQQRVGQATAAGSRAEQQFDELREEFRRRASQRFGEEMRDLREQARDLERREQQLAEQLREPEPDPDAAPMLQEADNSARREQVATELSQQRERLNNVQEQVRDTIERAEATEPLLTERLYETVRELRDQQTEQALQAAERAVRLGREQDARQLEELAGQGVQKLREGIERAAEGVLGDEAEALRRAREELRQLSQELNQELRRNAPDQALNPGEEPRDLPDPQNPQAGAAGQPADAPPREGEPQPGQRGPGQRPPGQPQPGEQRPGEPMPSEQTPMDQQPGQQRPGQQRGQQPGTGRGSQQRPGENPDQNQNQNSRGEPMPGSEPNPDEQPPGEQAPNEQNPSRNQPSQQRGQQPGQQTDRQPGQPSNQQQPGGRQPGSQQPGQQQQGGRQPGERQQGGANTGGAWEGGFEPRAFDEQAAPLTGNNFRDWADRLRDVEEMVDSPELRAEAARIRERARALRAESQRHSEQPQWDLVREQVAKPLAELHNRVAEELLRQTSKKALVPLDRDPVPPQYSEKTRRYYERLGSGR